MSLSMATLRPRNSIHVRMPVDGTARVPSREYGVFGEEAFLPMLSHERRRSERSGKPFLLLLLESDLYRGSRGEILVEQLVTAIGTATRETDIVGWYSTDQVIGIIFTEIAEVTDKAVQAILTRVTTSLSRSLDLAVMDGISITCHLYPDQGAAMQGPQDVRVFFAGEEGEREPRKIELAAKRAMDLAGSLSFVIVFAPVFLIIMLLVKLTSPGPVFYRQTRMGRFGEAFTFLKFRSMYTDSDSKIHKDYVTRFINGKGETHADGNNQVFKITNDPRVTPIGRFIRRTSLDELPQFFNVLRGDMSLVGPRPPVPYEYECYGVWHRKRVFEVKPGITGLWQVEGRSKTNFDEMVRLDLQYSRTWSLWGDVKILLRTPFAMFSGSY